MTHHEKRQVIINVGEHLLDVIEKVGQRALRPTSTRESVASEIKSKDIQALLCKHLGHSKVSAGVLSQSMDDADLRIRLLLLIEDFRQQYVDLIRIAVDVLSVHHDIPVSTSAERKEVACITPMTYGLSHDVSSAVRVWANTL